MNNLNEKIKIFLDKIYFVKVLMTMHKCLIRAKGDFAGFLQSNLIYRLVLIEMNNLFGDGNKLRLSEITTILDEDGLKKKFGMLLAEGYNLTQLLVATRKNYFAHTDTFDSSNGTLFPSMDYQKYFQLLTNIEHMISVLSSDPTPTIHERFKAIEDYDYAVKDLKEIIHLYASHGSTMV